ncbi:MAG: MtaA/CmuA family methyltransferase [Clostridia bacterium]|nr:MtaA/CmuA family methyltransferase [Clostridia bacterium]
MTPKNRLIAVLNKEKADRAPCICPGGMMNMITEPLMEKADVFLPDAHTDSEKMAQLALSAYENGCFENAGVPFCMTVEAENMGASADLGNRHIEPRVTKYVMDSVDEIDKLTAFDVTKGRAKVVLDAIKIIKNKAPDLPVIGNITGPVSTASSLIEPMVFYRQLRKKKDEAHAFMSFVTDGLVNFALAQVEAGADIIAISDPSGTGEILGPKYFEEFAVQYINRIVDAVKAKNAHVIVHICGHMNAVYAQMNDIRADALSFDSVVPMKEARANLPDRVLMGNVSTYTLEFGSPEKVALLTRECMKNGSDILAPACGLGMRSPLVNTQAILKGIINE